MENYGFLSVVPPILAIVFAVVTRNVLISLGFGVYLGMVIASGWDPFAGLAAFVEKGVFAQLAKPSNAQIVIIISAIGGFVYLLEKSGGMRSFANKITKWVDSAFKAQIAVWFTGMCIFFTDSGNSLILGPLFRPIFDKLKVCREKLAYIIDSTSSPVCVLIPVIGWGVYIMSLMEQSFLQINYSETEPLFAFFQVIQFQFYPLLALMSVPLLAWFGKEYATMAKAAKKCMETADDEMNEEGCELNAGPKAVFIPLLVLLGLLILQFSWYVYDLDNLPGGKVRTSLAIAYIFAAFSCAWVLRKETGTSYKDSFEIFISGVQRMIPVLMVLILAWSLGDVCKLLNTSNYIAGLVGASVSPKLLPAVFFLFGAVISLSTGSSWGTFAILIPIAIPLASGMGAPLFAVIAAVLSGGIFGDHASPISDTTILSSMSTGCEHADHVNTQLPYAGMTGLASLLAFVASGWLKSFWPMLIGVIALVVLHGLAIKLFNPKSVEKTS
jgi:Na+/H+ antiporter NhaC